MNIQYRCPQCGEISRREFSRDDQEASCTHCTTSLRLTPNAWSRSRLDRCLVCPGHELYVRKDFSQRLGVAIVVLGFAISCVTWYDHRILLTYAVLFATALFDVVLYLVVGNVVECYNCHALYRDIGSADDWQPFSLDTYERYRQEQARRAGASGQP